LSVNLSEKRQRSALARKSLIADYRGPRLLVARTITAQREQTARRIAAKLGIAVPAASRE
jgi:hypothetical protein